MADSDTKLTISIETILRGLDKTLRGLAQVEKSLQSIASGKGIAGAVAKQQAREQRAAEALQRQRSAALIAAERKRLTAVESLQRQRSASLITQARQRDVFEARQAKLRQARLKEETRQATQVERVRIRASESLQRQRSQALIKQFKDDEKAQARAAIQANRLGPPVDAHVRAFRALERVSKQATQNILGIGNALRSVGQGLASLGATLSVTLTAPLVAAGVASVDAAVRLDSLKRGLAAIVGSTDEANRQLVRLTQIAKLPGIGFEEAIQGSIRLQAVGFSALEAERNLREFANAIALTGGGRDELARVTVQLGQLAAKGKVLSQDLRPIIEAAPAVGRALLQAFGTVNADDIQELGLSSKQFLGVLTDELSRLPRAAAGAKNSFENFKDEVFRAAAAVGEALLPGLIRLAEVAGPIITKLAEGFARLPGPLQVIVVGVGALLAALGPVLFIVGQLTLGVGRLLVGFVELNTAGIIPSIAGLRAYAVAALNAASAQQKLFIGSIALGGGLGALVTAFGAALISYQLYNAFQKDAVTLSKERVEQLSSEVRGLEQQAAFLNKLQGGVEGTADEQERLLEIYNQLNVSAKVRINGIEDEEERLAALREELERILKLRQGERAQQAASLAAVIANNALAVEAEEEAVQRTIIGVQVRTRLIETLRETNKVTADQSRQVKALTAGFGSMAVTTTDAQTAIDALQHSNRLLVQRQDDLRESGKGVRSTLKEQVPLLQQLTRETGLTERQLLAIAKTMGTFQGDLEFTSTLLEQYTARTKDATTATDEFRQVMSGQTAELIKAGEAADQQAKKRRVVISAAASLAREASDSFEGAEKTLRAFIAAQPDLREAVERERKLQGKSLNEFIEDALGAGKRKGRSGTGLRNAQEQLQQALADLAQSSTEHQVATERLKNERLLQVNENGFRLQLISYREYLNERARLTSANLALEIDAEKQVVADAIAERNRLAQRAVQGGVPAPERAKAAAGAAAAQERAVKAGIRILELEQRQRDLRIDIAQQLAESAKQQEKDVRQLDIEFAELGGRIEDALNTATVERFREQLEALGREQKRINQELEVARLARDADDVEQLERASRLNQSQIDLIEGIVAQVEATNALAAAQRLVEQAKERQQQLEQRIAFEVEFRGLAEEDATKKRLAGEQALLKSLGNSFHTIRQIVQALEARGVQPPQALLDFLKQIRVETENLGELSLAEQFAREEKEFERLNDERLRRIADVERAVRNRTIAEAEGLLLIRRINGEYVGDLQRQVDLLKDIAVRSNDANLQRQAASAAEVAKDAADRLADLDAQIRSTSIDALQDGFTNFFLDLTDRSQSALEDLLSFIDSVTRRINEVIAENLSRKLVESLFGGSTETAGGGILAGIKRLFGFGDGGAGAAGSAGGSVSGAVQGATQQTAATTAAATLQAGATAAATTETASAVGFATAVTTAAAAFATAVAAAGAAFAATVTASSAARSAAALSGSGIGNFATGDILPARPGGRIVRVAEGGHAEAVLTTDPQHALRQARLLGKFLRMTRGLQGRFPVPELASGALVTPRQAEADLLSGITRTPLNTAGVGDLRLAAAGGGETRLRQVLVDQRNYRDWLTSSEGEQVIVDLLYRNQPVIRKLGGK